MRREVWPRSLISKSDNNSNKGYSFSDNLSMDDSSSMDGTSSTASFDRICNDLLVEGLGGAALYTSPSSSSMQDDWGDVDDGATTTSSVESAASSGWPLGHRQRSRCLHKLRSLPHPANNRNSYGTCWNETPIITEFPVKDEMELMKERYAKLLLGEDLSGGGKGACTALALSNAITNLSASVFGEIWRLEPLSPERKAYWRREMDWLLAVSDHIVEFVPSEQTLPNGSIVEVMVMNQRSDLQMNLPALKKLDAMLLDALDSFSDAEFWYAEENSDERRQEDKWLLPTPKLPVNGLSESARRHVQHQKESANQILKAAFTINCQILSEMETPKAYLDALHKNARTSLGEAMYKIINSEKFNPEVFITSFDFSNEHTVVELINRVEAAVYIWRRKIQVKNSQSTSKDLSKMSGNTNNEQERREILVDRGLSLLLLIRQKFPGLPQSILEVNKIQYNKDVGKAILECYSRVLESLAFSIMSRVEDVLHADNVCKRSNHQGIGSFGAYILSRSSSNSSHASRTSSSSSRFHNMPHSSSASILPTTTSNNNTTTESPRFSSSPPPLPPPHSINRKSMSPTRHGSKSTLSDFIGWNSPPQ